MVVVRVTEGNRGRCFFLRFYLLFTKRALDNSVNRGVRLSEDIDRQRCGAVSVDRVLLSADLS